VHATDAEAQSAATSVTNAAAFGSAPERASRATMPGLVVETAPRRYNHLTRAPIARQAPTASHDPNSAQVLGARIPFRFVPQPPSVASFRSGTRTGRANPKDYPRTEGRSVGPACEVGTGLRELMTAAFRRNCQTLPEDPASWRTILFHQRGEQGESATRSARDRRSGGSTGYRAMSIILS